MERPVASQCISEIVESSF